MWIRLILFLIILSAIDDSWEEKIKNRVIKNLGFEGLVY